MSQGSKLFFVAIILYSIIAGIAEKVMGYNYFQVLDTLLLACILYNLLDWKFQNEEEIE